MYQKKKTRTKTYIKIQYCSSLHMMRRCSFSERGPSRPSENASLAKESVRYLKNVQISEHVLGLPIWENPSSLNFSHVLRFKKTPVTPPALLIIQLTTEEPVLGNRNHLIVIAQFGNSKFNFELGFLFLCRPKKVILSVVWGIFSNS